MIYVMDLYRSNPRAGGVIQFAENLCSITDGISSAFEFFKESRAYKLLASLGFLSNRFILESLLVRFLPKNCDGLIFANYFTPFWLPYCIRIKSVVVVHDLQFKYFPQYFSFWKRIWLDWSLRRSLRLCSKVVCISESTRDDMIKYYGRSDKYFVIYNPVRIFGNSHNSINASLDEHDYFFANFHFYPHKNIERLISLWVDIVRSGLKVGLVFTGGGKAYVENLISILAEDGVKEYFHHVGYVSDSELSVLRANCKGFVSLSKFEGFNMSAAEAALSKVPLVLSDIPVHREIFSGCAEFVSTEASFNELYDAVESALNSERVNWSYVQRTSCECVVSMYRDLFKLK